MRKRIAKYIGLPLTQVYWKVCKPKTEGCKAIVVHDDHILLIKNLNKDYWSLPGGGKKKKEHPMVSTIRELQEELSIDPVIEHKLGEYDARWEGKRDKMHVYVARVSHRSFSMQWELDDARWFHYENIPHDANPATIRRIQEYKQGHKEIVEVW
jgi:ADP-ribose pyrophosphatase YjhB (NUDIX family)